MPEENQEAIAKNGGIYGRYRKVAMLIMYPPIVSFFGLCFSLLTRGYSSAICLSVSHMAETYFSSNPIGGNVAWGNVIILGSAILIAGVFAFLALKASKGKLWAIIAALALYSADFAYSIAMLFPSVYPHTDAIVGSLMVAIHACFLATYGIIFIYYAKLLRDNSNEG